LDLSDIKEQDLESQVMADYKQTGKRHVLFRHNFLFSFFNYFGRYFLSHFYLEVDLHGSLALVFYVIGSLALD
jgi:hypothetical protein